MKRDEVFKCNEGLFEKMPSDLQAETYIGWSKLIWKKTIGKGSS